ncbi:MAG: fibronectin type III domain-containing protein [Eubacteriaceae bacterium]|nr:fibronectin type III domain-containing protein [Eubacteriaceae bacterium]
MKKHIGKRLLPVLLAVCVIATPGFSFAASKTSARASALKDPNVYTYTLNYTQIKVKWQKVKGAKGYIVYRASSPSGTFKRVKTVKGYKNATWTNKKLKKNTPYWYKVRAYKKGSKGKLSYARKGWAGVSNVIDFSYDTNDAMNQLRVCLNNNSHKYFNMYISDSENGSYKKIKANEKTKEMNMDDYPVYGTTVENLTPLKTYYVKFKVIRKIGKKTYYSDVSKTYKCEMTKPEPVFTAKSYNANGTSTDQLTLDVTLNKNCSTATIKKDDFYYSGWKRASSSKVDRASAELHMDAPVTFKPGETKRIILKSDESFVYFENASISGYADYRTIRGGSDFMITMSVSPDPEPVITPTVISSGKVYDYYLLDSDDLSENNDGNAMFTFTAEKTGIVNISCYDLKLTNGSYLDDADRPIYTMTDSSGKKLDEYINGESDPQKFYHGYGVKAGEKYGFKIRLTGAKSQGKIKISYKAINEKSGATKGKSATIKKNKYVSGYTKAGEKTSDWYKFKVSKKQKVSVRLKTMYFYADTDLEYINYFGYNIYNSKGKRVTGLKTKSSKGKANTFSYGTDTITKRGYLKKGTYYVKIKSNTVSPCGNYSLKWYN